MSLLFSKVEISTESESVEFLMGGIPRDEDDLKGWLAYDNFAEDVEDETEITVHVEAFLYGGGETVQASAEEIAYFYSRIDGNPDFLSERCDNIEDVDYAFLLTPKENEEMEME